LWSAEACGGGYCGGEPGECGRGGYRRPAGDPGKHPAEGSPMLDRKNSKETAEGSRGRRGNWASQKRGDAKISDVRFCVGGNAMKSEEQVPS